MGWAIVTALLLLIGCQKNTAVQPPAPPTLTAEQRIEMNEGIPCSIITVHLDGDSPDCVEIVKYFSMGRDRFAKFNPFAINVKMSNFLFIRPKRYFYPEKPYPLIILMPEELLATATPEVKARNTVGGVTCAECSPILVQYAYPAAIEHEATHAIARILYPTVLRDPVVAARSSEPNAQYFFQITCHGTEDDPLGIPGKPDSCDTTRTPYR